MSPLYLAGVEPAEGLLPKMALYCGGPPGGAANKHFRADRKTLKGIKRHHLGEKKNVGQERYELRYFESVANLLNEIAPLCSP